MSNTAAALAAGPSGIVLPVTSFSRAVDRFIGWVGEVASALWLVLVLVIVVQVVARYAFGTGSIAMEEVQWHLYSIGFMLGLSFTEMRERNVRIDVLAERFGQRKRLWIELFGLLLMFLPFTIFVLWSAVPFFWSSYQLNETSAAAGGLPYRWFLKSFIVTAFALLVLVGLSRLTRVWAALSARH
ncbi:MAG TPA: TRAP transporter small permease subunit [Rubrivivax sp.]|nr:TRAP transporter small permease subunit [Rubrivivax sp.]